jgi:hypothetical protein
MQNDTNVCCSAGQVLCVHRWLECVFFILPSCSVTMLTRMIRSLHLYKYVALAMSRWGVADHDLCLVHYEPYHYSCYDLYIDYLFHTPLLALHGSSNLPFYEIHIDHHDHHYADLFTDWTAASASASSVNCPTSASIFVNSTVDRWVPTSCATSLMAAEQTELPHQHMRYKVFSRPRIAFADFSLRGAPNITWRRGSGWQQAVDLQPCTSMRRCSD